MVLARRVAADGHPRRRPCRGRPDPRRRRRRRPVRRPQPVRVLDRHRTAGRLLGRAEPAPTLTSRQPPGQPHDPHRRGHPAAARHRRPRLLPTQASRREEAAKKRCAASSDGSQTPSTSSSSPTPPSRWRGPGRALRGVSRIQRGRPAPAHRHFGSATPGPAPPTLRRTTRYPEEAARTDPSEHRLTTEGSRSDPLMVGHHRIHLQFPRLSDRSLSALLLGVWLEQPTTACDRRRYPRPGTPRRRPGC